MTYAEAALWTYGGIVLLVVCGILLLGERRK